MPNRPEHQISTVAIVVPATAPSPMAPQAQAGTEPSYHTGAIRTLLKGCGFIALDGGGECFFHKSDLVDAYFSALEVGQRVACGLTREERGPRAQQVRLLSS